MNLIIFGPPGAGKGTQADFIVNKFNLFKLSTGEVLRNEIKNKTQLGKEIFSIINSGSLVSDNIVERLVETFIADKKSLIFSLVILSYDNSKGIAYFAHFFT